MNSYDAKDGDVEEDDVLGSMDMDVAGDSGDRGAGDRGAGDRGAGDRGAGSSSSSGSSALGNSTKVGIVMKCPIGNHKIKHLENTFQTLMVIYPSIHKSICISIYLSIEHMSIYLSIYRAYMTVFFF
jgi:hypothetical protein